MANANKIRGDLRTLVATFFTRSWSDTVRRELGDTITAAYVARFIERDEYQNMMAAIR